MILKIKKVLLIKKFKIIKEVILKIKKVLLIKKFRIKKRSDFKNKKVKNQIATSLQYKQIPFPHPEGSGLLQ